MNGGLFSLCWMMSKNTRARYICSCIRTYSGLMKRWNWTDWWNEWTRWLLNEFTNPIPEHLEYSVQKQHSYTILGIEGCTCLNLHPQHIVPLIPWKTKTAWLISLLCFEPNFRITQICQKGKHRIQDIDEVMIFIVTSPQLLVHILWTLLKVSIMKTLTQQPQTERKHRREIKIN